MNANNFIIHQQASQYQWSGDCFLSIKSFYNGSAKYRVQQREYTVNENNYLILNDCTKYNLTIDNISPIESFCVFFTPEFVCQIVSELNSSEEQLLDFSIKRAEGIKLLERNYQHGGEVSKILSHGRRASVRTISEMEKEEFYFTLLNAILFQNSDALKVIDRLTSKKKSTKEEIYRRLLYAKDFIDSNYSENLTLKKISQVAMLSENHLLRNFSQIFEISPFQYITQLKVTEARRQIIETNKSITEIVTSLGYSSLSNFSYYFKNTVGLSPVALRKKGDT
ncbi:AraC-like DNA-binding protein [Algoriphagus sp. 4150]|uniref:helix-turn-helix domain-containing protein n=1 Tax=Algoriphagus sp. 4150 TaxID=2817756 RepID=UPI00285599CD|nr:AraC family transcriptional regulator [Algoriphagus sp. 4150]MDR7130111.1 AraC-like DNA-binding protein [Algoriphagus sp. 4150]